MAFTLDQKTFWGLTLLSTRNQEEDCKVNIISSQKPVQNISHQGRDKRVAREMGNVSDCRVQD